MTRKFKLGRRPRIFDPRVPKMADVRARAGAPAPVVPPPSINYATGMPGDLGMMLNDQLGDCVEAAAGHAIQVWSFNATGSMLTPPDSDIEVFYEEAGGYVPGNPSTDNGTVIQVALQDWLNQSDAIDGNVLAGFIEIDPCDVTDLKRTIFECALCYIGFVVPSYLDETPGATWDYDPNGDNTIIGGHCVIVVGYLPDGRLVVISWGAIYFMTPAFWQRFVDEAYALADKAWIETTGKSPAGLTLPELEALMATMKGAPPSGTRRQHRRRKRHRAQRA